MQAAALVSIANQDREIRCFCLLLVCTSVSAISRLSCLAYSAGSVLLSCKPVKPMQDTTHITCVQGWLITQSWAKLVRFLFIYNSRNSSCSHEIIKIALRQTPTALLVHRSHLRRSPSAVGNPVRGRNGRRVRKPTYRGLGARKVASADGEHSRGHVSHV